MTTHLRPYLVLAALALGVTLLACGSTEAATSTVASEPGGGQPVSPTQPAEAAATIEEAAPQPSPLSIYVVDVVDPSSPGMFYTAQAGMHLVSVRVLIDNQSQDVISVNPLNSTLVDDQGLVHTSELAASDELAQITALDLYPGERIAGWVSFALEDGSVPARLKYELNMFTGDLIEASIAADMPEPALGPFSGSISAPRLGDVSTASGYSLTAEEVVDPSSPSSFFTPAEGTRLVSVKILLRNESATDALSVNPFYCFLVDDNGFVYSTELGASDLGQIDTVDLGLGEAARGYVTFQVPSDRAPLYVRFSTDFWGGDQPLLVGVQE